MEKKTSPWAEAAEEILTRLETSSRGLETEEAHHRLGTSGANVLELDPVRGFFTFYVLQFKSPINYLLVAAAFLSLGIGELFDAFFIIAVLQLNMMIGALQEWQSEKSAASLRKLVPQFTTLRRSGKPVLVRSEDVVPGDVLLLESGVRVPVDARLIKSHEMQVDESLLTGESEPSHKDAKLILYDRASLPDQRNMVFSGTFVERGRGEAVVVATGMNTVIGALARSLSRQAGALPPLVYKLQKFVKVIALVTVVFVAALAAAQFLQGMDFNTVFFTAVALVVSAIPEGLPVALTVTLSVGRRRMALRQVIIRSLPAVEGLGACTYIASDKTGTLTQNKLTLQRVWLPEGGMFEVSGTGFDLKGEVRRDGQPLTEKDLEALQATALAGLLCNEARLVFEKGGVRVDGDTVDGAFLIFSHKVGLDPEALKGYYPQIACIPYESEKRFAAVINQRDGMEVLYAKGAIETILNMTDGKDRERIGSQAEKMAEEGFRVLALAFREVPLKSPGEVEDHLEKMTFLGLVGLIDPIRPEVPESVRRAFEAGIQVAMVTGDHPKTAFAIAKALGLAEKETQVMTGDAFMASSDKALLLKEKTVFARMLPDQKLALVQESQKQGHYVAVTGDGVNDAPALKAANIGVAMGRSGTDVARNVADLILTDDNFSSIVSGIEEGRIAYANVRKVVYFLVSCGLAEIILFFLALVFGYPLPLFAVQLLWLNLVTNSTQHMALAFEKGEGHILKEPPRSPKEPLFNRLMWQQVLTSGILMGGIGFIFFVILMKGGMSETASRNALLLLMVFFENVHAFNCRSERTSLLHRPFFQNKFLIVGVFASQGIHIGAMHIPLFQKILRVEPLTLEMWVLLIPVAFLMILGMEAFKLFKRA